MTLLLSPTGGLLQARREPARTTLDSRNFRHPRLNGPVDGVVILAGSVRESPLTLATGRSPLELPLQNDVTLLDHWMSAANAMRASLSMPELPVRMMLNPRGYTPTMASALEQLDMSVEMDRATFRGTGGVLRDLTQHYDDDALLLVVNSVQVVLRPLVEILELLQRASSDVSLLTEPNGSPGGAMLIRCGALREIPLSGYVDLKEQALPQIARSHVVQARQSARQVGFPLRCPRSYLEALRAYHLHLRGVDPTGSFVERWSSPFAVIERGSHVDPQAEIYDSVVLRDGTVRAGARVVRSVVCRDGVVRRGQRCRNLLLRPASPETH